MLRSWRNFRAQAGRVHGHVTAQPCTPKAPGRVPSGAGVGARQGVLTELLQEDACHLLGEEPAHADEAGEVPAGAELHDQVDVVTVPHFCSSAIHHSLFPSLLPQRTLSTLFPQRSKLHQPFFVHRVPCKRSCAIFRANIKIQSLFSEQSWFGVPDSSAALQQAQPSPPLMAEQVSPPRRCCQ